jgi:hypothetical protein
VVSCTTTSSTTTRTPTSGTPRPAPSAWWMASAATAYRDLGLVASVFAQGLTRSTHEEDCDRAAGHGRLPHTLLERAYQKTDTSGTPRRPRRPSPRSRGGHFDGRMSATAASRCAATAGSCCSHGTSNTASTAPWALRTSRAAAPESPMLRWLRRPRGRAMSWWLARTGCLTTS